MEGLRWQTRQYLLTLTLYAHDEPMAGMGAKQKDREVSCRPAESGVLSSDLRRAPHTSYNSDPVMFSNLGDSKSPTAIDLLPTSAVWMSPKKLHTYHMRVYSSSFISYVPSESLGRDRR